jgi:hypothetical protein
MAAILALPPLLALVTPVYAVLAMAVFAVVIVIVEQGVKRPAA